VKIPKDVSQNHQYARNTPPGVLLLELKISRLFLTKAQWTQVPQKGSLDGVTGGFLSVASTFFPKNSFSGLESQLESESESELKIAANQTFFARALPSASACRDVW
jgi:hypothetical protein